MTRLAHGLFLLALMAVTFWPRLALAERAIVRAGEHPDFTRLVIELDAPAGWQLGRYHSGYELALPETADRVDLSRVFLRIRRHRLAAISHSERRRALQLRLGCACHATAFLHDGRYIVIDIRDGLAPSHSPFEAPVGGLLPARARPGGAARRYDWISLWQEARAGTRAHVGIAAPAGVGAARSGEALASHLAAALYGPDWGIGPDLASIFAPLAPEAVPGLRLRPPDRPERDPGGPDRATAVPVCPAEEQVDLRLWAPHAPLAALEIAGYRADLYEEFDTPREGAILTAVRRHIGIGFGAEALQLLDLLPEGGEVRTLRAMARLADLEVPGGATLQRFDGCDGAISFWLALDVALRARANLPDSRAARLDHDAVVRIFSGLLPDLRRHFGPPLIEYFLAQGEGETARLLRAALLRGGGG